VCANPTVPTTAGLCFAPATVNGGSFDPDGDPVTLTQSPAGPYALGQTGVTLLATDPSGASASCHATVTVVDLEPPTVSCARMSRGGLYQVTASDNCGAPTLMLGWVALTPGETIKITRTPGRSGTRLVNVMDTGIRHFHAGPGDVKVEATDGAGNKTTATCPVPAR
jgi:hypothetical protein